MLKSKDKDEIFCKMVVSARALGAKMYILLLFFL